MALQIKENWLFNGGGERFKAAGAIWHSLGKLKNADITCLC